MIPEEEEPAPCCILDGQVGVAGHVQEPLGYVLVALDKICHDCHYSSERAQNSVIEHGVDQRPGLLQDLR